MNQTPTIIAAILLGLLLVPNALVSMSTMSRRADTDALVQKHLQAGEAALKENKLPFAETAFRMALNLDPASQAAQVGLTVSQAKHVTTKTDSLSRADAIELQYRLTHALETDPANAVLYQHALATVAVGLQDQKAAQDWFAKATSAKNASAAVWSARGAYELGRGQQEAAAKSLDAALKLDAEFGAALLSKGMLLKEQKKYPEAIAVLQKASGTLSGPKVWYELGDTQLRDSKFEDAYNAFVSAAKVHPNVNREPSLLMRLGVTAYRVKKYQEAIRYLTQAAKIDSNPEVLVNLAVAYQGTGEHAAAAQQLAKVIEKDPAHAEARAYLMKSMVQLNQIDAARKLGRQYLTLARNRPAMKAGAQIIQRVLAQLVAVKSTKPTNGAKPASK